MDAGLSRQNDGRGVVAVGDSVAGGDVDEVMMQSCWWYGCVEITTWVTTVCLCGF